VFVVRLRDDAGNFMPGVRCGDNGPKQGLLGVDNGQVGIGRGADGGVFGGRQVVPVTGGRAWLVAGLLHHLGYGSTGACQGRRGSGSGGGGRSSCWHQRMRASLTRTLNVLVPPCLCMMVLVCCADLATQCARAAGRPAGPLCTGG